MHLHLRAPQRALFVAAAAFLASISSVATADDTPAPETKDQGRTVRSTPKWWNIDASDSKVDSFGAFSDAISIDVPAFRTIAPVLSLSYRSSAGNGWVGVGWNLDGVGRIERASPGKGAPRYDASDIYLLDGQELVPCATGSVSPSCTTGGTHSTKTESFSRIALTGTGTSARFTITEKDGTKTVYAPSFTVPGDTSKVFRWGISQVVDTKNNVVTYNWGAHQFGGSWEYLDSISYNGTTVKFYYEQRSDSESGGIGAGKYELILGRLKSIDVAVSGDRLRAYKLSYTTSGATGRSLLSSVQQFGKDAILDASGTVTGGTSLPAIAAGYPAATTPSFVSGFSDSEMINNADERFVVLDVNGDGKSDMLEVIKSCFVLCSHKAAVWLSDGNGFYKSSEISLPSYNKQAQFLAMDINGDGKDDFVALTRNGTKYKRSIFLSNGTGFTAGATDSSINYKENSDEEVLTHVLPMDINGDGKTDILELYQNCFLVCTYQRVAWISNGTSFTQASSESGIATTANTQFLAMDFNGDGKSDFVEINPGLLGVSQRRVWLSNGTSFSQFASDNSSYASGLKALAMDVNGDGKTDLVEIVPMGLISTRKTWLSTGSTFVLGSSWSGLTLNTNVRLVPGDFNGDGRSDFISFAPLGLSVQRAIFLSTGSDFVQGTTDGLANGGDHRYLSADVNGDGRTDMIETYSLFGVTGRKVHLTGGPSPDLLTSLGTGFGGTTTVSYTPSSAWANASGSPIVQTATSVTVADGRGGSATTTYRYSGLKYDTPNQRSLGFAYQRETEPCIAGETACPYNEIWFRQDNGAVGKPSRLDQRDGSGTLFRSELFEYTTNGATLPWTALETGRWMHAYTGTNAGTACPGADCKRRYASRAFNAYGELTQEVEYGDYDVTGDEKTLSTVYVPNTTQYIVDRVADAKVFQGVGTTGALLNETVTYYDGATNWNQAPSAGLTTKSAHWLSSPSAFVATSSEYDGWGNIIATVNALGARTTTAFDPTYHRYPITVTNALDQVTSTTWDPVCAVPTQTTNVNGQLTTLTYDPLCRLSQKSAPGGKFETHIWVNLGDPANQYEEVQRPSADGTAQPWWSRRYFDGLHRSWREVKKGPDAGSGNIYVDKMYNARGEQASKTEPYYGGATIYTTTFGYDALDRPTLVTFPGGAKQITSYGIWTVTLTDELGHAKTDRFDAYGQRVAHDEIVSGATKTTAYAYDARHALRQSTDPVGNIVSYTTDSLGRMRSMVDPSWGTFTYDYDVANRLISQLDPKSQKTTFGYDALGRKTIKTSLVGTTQASTSSWTYDESRAGFYNLGELTTVTDDAGTKELDYDVAGRVVSSARTIHGATYVFQYGFDAGDRSLWTTYPDGDTLGRAAAPLVYDSAGRLKSIPGYVSTVLYDARDQAIQIDNANGTRTTRSYSSGRGWLTGVATTAGGTVIQNLVYTRNDKGLVSQVTSPVGNEGWTFGYDALDRVTTATNSSSSTYNQSLTYDAIGNITSNSRLGSYSYGSRPHAVTSAGDNTYVYDAAGLMISGAGRTLTWDGDNRLASVTSGGTTSTFTYDADGARIQQNDGMNTHRYLGDDYEVDGLGHVTKYIVLGDLLVARKDGTARTWLHTDHLGSIQAETAESGVEVQRRKYRPYGEILSDSESLEFEPRGYTGQRHDVSGLVYLHARYYDPALGRFISPDLIVDGMDTVGLNRHAYVGNNPVNATDPSGLAAVVRSPSNSGTAKDKSKVAPPPPSPPPPPGYPAESAPPAPLAPPPLAPPANLPTMSNGASTVAAKTVRSNVVRLSLGTPTKPITVRLTTTMPGDNERGGWALNNKRGGRALNNKRGGRAVTSETNGPPRTQLLSNGIPTPQRLFPASPYLDCLQELDAIDQAIDPILPPDGAAASGAAIERMCFDMHVGR